MMAPTDESATADEGGSDYAPPNNIVDPGEQEQRQTRPKRAEEPLGHVASLPLLEDEDEPANDLVVDEEAQPARVATPPPPPAKSSSASLFESSSSYPTGSDDRIKWIKVK